jgi:hypothetical protein
MSGKVSYFFIPETETEWNSRQFDLIRFDEGEKNARPCSEYFLSVTADVVTHHSVFVFPVRSMFSLHSSMFLSPYININQIDF